MALRPRHRSWTDEETRRLRAHIERGGSAARAAVMFHRTQGAVRAHAATCGLKFPTISELRRKAAGSPRSAHPRYVFPEQSTERLAARRVAVASIPEQEVPS
jgi:hypothetical protein